MSSLRIPTIIVALSVAVGAAAVSADGKPSSSTAKAPITVGVVVPLTGPVSVYGIGAAHGAALAAHVLNTEGGGVLGHKLKVVFGDDVGTPATGVNEMRRVITQGGADFVIGGVTTPVGLAQLAAFKDKLMWSLAKSDLITQQGLPYVFQTNLPFSLGDKYFNAWMDRNLKPKRLAILAENTATGQQTVQYMKPHYGDKIVYLGYFNTTATDFSVQLAQVAQAKPDVVFLDTASDAAMALLLRQIGQFGVKATIALTIGTQLSPTSLEASKQVPGKIYTADIYSEAADNPQNAIFVKAYEKKYGYAPDKEAALAYDAVLLTAQAMRKVGCTTCTAKVAARLRTHQWRSVRGPLYINNAGLGTTATVFTWQVVNGRMVALKK